MLILLSYCFRLVEQVSSGSIAVMKNMGWEQEAEFMVLPKSITLDFPQHVVPGMKRKYLKTNCVMKTAHERRICTMCIHIRICFQIMHSGS